MNQNISQVLEQLAQQSHSSSIDTGTLEIGRTLGRLEEGARRRERTVDHVLKIVIGMTAGLAGWILRGLG